MVTTKFKTLINPLINETKTSTTAKKPLTFSKRGIDGISGIAILYSSNSREVFFIKERNGPDISTCSTPAILRGIAIKRHTKIREKMIFLIIFLTGNNSYNDNNNSDR